MEAMDTTQNEMAKARDGKPSEPTCLMTRIAVEALPKRLNFVSSVPASYSAWSKTSKVTGRDKYGGKRSFFMKVAKGDQGRTMLKGEYESSLMIWDKMRSFIPMPTTWGEFYPKDGNTDKSGPYSYYMCEFVEMEAKEKLDPAEFTKKLAEMHRSTQSVDGKFGFHVPTCDGKVVHTVAWEDSWSVFFRKLLLGVYKENVEANGKWDELERATQHIADKVVPILLDNLTAADGSKIKPSLIHGDLWEGNAGVRAKNKEPLIFDAGSYYAHHEMELGSWRCRFTKDFRDETYTDHYLEEYQGSKERDDRFDDRVRLYSLKGTLNYAAGHPETEKEVKMRLTALNDMRFLCEKYAQLDGIGKYDRNLDPAVTGEVIVPHEGKGAA